MEEVNKIVKSIEIISKPAKNWGRNYFCKLELINGSSTEIFIEKELGDAILFLKKENNGQAFKRKELVEEFSEKVGKKYVCVLIELIDGTIFRFFPKFSFGIIINGLLNKQNIKK